MVRDARFHFVFPALSAPGFLLVPLWFTLPAWQLACCDDEQALHVKQMKGSVRGGSGPVRVSHTALKELARWMYQSCRRPFFVNHLATSGTMEYCMEYGNAQSIYFF